MSTSVSNENRIALVSVYFGKLPWYFSFFLRSCAANSNVTFYIVTDQPGPPRLPENVHIVTMTLPELQQIMSRKLGFEVSLTYAYKLCDYKPSYGIIFDDLLSEYSFWGYCDIDLIFGDIRGFITDDVLDQHDVITIREDYLAGYFTLFRNQDVINRLFQQSRDYRLVFTSEEHFCFDECNFLFVHLAKGLDILEIDSQIESLTHVARRYQKAGLLRVYFDHHALEGKIGDVKYDMGRLLYKDQFEIILFHLINFKDQLYLSPPHWKKIPDAFYINANSFTIYPPSSWLGRLSILKTKYKMYMKSIPETIRFYRHIWTSKIKEQGGKRSEGGDQFISARFKSNDWVIFLEYNQVNAYLHISINNYDKQLTPSAGDHIEKIMLSNCDGLYFNKKWKMQLIPSFNWDNSIQSFDLKTLHQWSKTFVLYNE